MSDELKKLLEGLPIKVVDKECAEIDGGRYLRSQIKHRADNATGTGEQLAYRLILALMDEYEEPKPAETPTWKPGTVLRGYVGHRLRLDKLIENGSWDYTSLESGNTGNAFFECPGDYEVHRLPHEFKVGDWFECDYCKEERQPYGPFKVTSITRNDRIYDNRDTLALNHAPDSCRHVPAPRKEAIAELARQELADGHYVCDPQDPFTGAHWDAIRRGYVTAKGLPINKCLLDLADEVRRIREGKQ